MEGPKDEKLTVPRFNDHSTESFHLWKLRMEAVLETRNCLSIVEGSEQRPEDGANTLNEQQLFDKRSKKAAAIIVTALGDKPLKAVHKYAKSPSEIWKKLCKRYASTTRSNKLSLITEAFSKKKFKQESMMDHVAELETIFIKLDNVGHPLNELMQVAILLSSIKEDKDYSAVVADIRTMDENNASWDTVATRLVDEYKKKRTNRMDTRDESSDIDAHFSAAFMRKKAMKHCTFCKWNGHSVEECWENS